MKYRKYYVKQDELGDAIKEVVDDYLKGEITDVKLENAVNTIIQYNAEKFFVVNEPDKIAVRVQRKLGKRRQAIVEKIIEKYKEEK